MTIQEVKLPEKTESLLGDSMVCAKCGTWLGYSGSPLGTQTGLRLHAQLMIQLNNEQGHTSLITQSEWDAQDHD